MAKLCCLVPDCYQKLFTIESGASFPRPVNAAVHLLLDMSKTTSSPKYRVTQKNGKFEKPNKN
jgi:hypothetical protein